jgi:hypothetical protein
MTDADMKFIINKRGIQFFEGPLATRFTLAKVCDPLICGSLYTEFTESRAKKRYVAVIYGLASGPKCAVWNRGRMKLAAEHGKSGLFPAGRKTIIQWDRSRQGSIAVNTETFGAALVNADNRWLENVYSIANFPV